MHGIELPLRKALTAGTAHPLERGQGPEVPVIAKRASLASGESTVSLPHMPFTRPLMIIKQHDIGMMPPGPRLKHPL